jgi:hypothetical protein
MNRELPRGARVLVLENVLALEFQRAYGRLRPDLEPTSDPAGAGWILVQMRQGMMSPELAALVRRARPEYRLELQGVPLVAIYRNGDPVGPAESPGNE